MLQLCNILQPCMQNTFKGVQFSRAAWCMPKVGDLMIFLWPAPIGVQDFLIGRWGCPHVWRTRTRSGTLVIRSFGIYKYYTLFHLLQLFTMLLTSVRSHVDEYD